MRILMIVLMLMMAASTAQALTHTETVKSRVEQAMQTVGQASLDGAAERRRGIRQAAVSLFDFAEMSKRALGRHWENRTAAERDEFVVLFTELMARAYMGKIDRYAGEAITYVGERVDGEQATVQSRVITPKKSEVPIEYRLHRVADRWAAYDVLVENVSLVGTYRSQFDRIIQASSFADLLRRMREKESALAEAPAR